MRTVPLLITAAIMAAMFTSTAQAATYKVKVPAPGVTPAAQEAAAPSAGTALAAMNSSGGMIWQSKVCDVGDASCSDGALSLGINASTSGIESITAETPTYVMCRGGLGSMTLAWNDPVSVKTIRVGTWNENGVHYGHHFDVSYVDPDRHGDHG